MRPDEDVLSPKELAGELQSSLPVVSYHVRELERTGIIRPRRRRAQAGSLRSA